MKTKTSRLKKMKKIWVLQTKIFLSKTLQWS